MAKSSLKIILLSLLPTFLSTSCERMVYDPEGDCETVYEVQFVYDHNLKWADAFASEVDAVTLHVFDASSGKLVASRTEKGDALAQEGYAMRLDIPAGDYEMVAWCGEGAHDDGYSFEIPDVDPATTRKEHLSCRMARSRDVESGNAIIDQSEGINHLYHGYLKASLPPEDGAKVKLRMPLVKDTNTVRVILQNLGGQEMTPEMFDFSIEDKNGLMDWDNTVLDDEPIFYKAWSVTGGSAEIVDDDFNIVDNGENGGKRSSKPMSAVVADFTIGRLMKGNKPYLTVRNKENDGEIVFRIPLVDYALMIKGNYKKGLDDQEYLDRQDEYNMTFFLDEKGNWINSVIRINQWKVVIGEYEME